MHRPGIEPGSPAWQASILPLDHRCERTEGDFRDRRSPVITLFASLSDASVHFTSSETCVDQSIAHPYVFVFALRTCTNLEQFKF